MTAEKEPTAWTVLGLRPGATETEVRDAYRELAKRYHPDRRPGDADAARRFQRISEAYAALRGARRARGGVNAPRRRRPAAHVAAATIAEIPAEGSLWVGPDSLIVAADRSVTVHADAMGTPFPTATHTVRVERRKGALHVFIPPQPSVRWALGPTGAATGLAVDCLWVGDRQEDRDVAAPRLPERLVVEATP